MGIISKTKIDSLQLINLFIVIEMFIYFMFPISNYG